MYLVWIGIQLIYAYHLLDFILKISSRIKFAHYLTQLYLDYWVEWSLHLFGTRIFLIRFLNSPIYPSPHLGLLLISSLHFHTVMLLFFLYKNNLKSFLDFGLIYSMESHVHTSHTAILYAHLNGLDSWNEGLFSFFFYNLKP